MLEDTWVDYRFVPIPRGELEGVFVVMDGDTWTPTTMTKPIVGWMTQALVPADGNYQLVEGALGQIRDIGTYAAFIEGGAITTVQGDINFWFLQDPKDPEEITQEDVIEQHNSIQEGIKLRYLRSQHPDKEPQELWEMLRSNG